MKPRKERWANSPAATSGRFCRRNRPRRPRSASVSPGRQCRYRTTVAKNRPDLRGPCQNRGLFAAEQPRSRHTRTRQDASVGTSVGMGTSVDAGAVVSVTASMSAGAGANVGASREQGCRRGRKRGCRRKRKCDRRHERRCERERDREHRCERERKRNECNG